MKSKKDAGGQTGLIIHTRSPDEQPDEPNDDSAAIESCAQELIRAVHAKDVQGVAAALKDAMDILQSGESDVEPHSLEASQEG